MFLKYIRYYCSYQRFDAAARRKGHFCFVFTLLPNSLMFLNKKKPFDHRFSCNNSYFSITKRLRIFTLILNNFLNSTFLICCILICLMLLRYKVEKFSLLMRVILNIKHILCLSIHFNLNVFICCNFQYVFENHFSV